MLLSVPIPAHGQDSTVPAGPDIGFPAGARTGAGAVNTELGAQGTAQPFGSDSPRVSIRVYGGLRQLWGGDVNEAVENVTRATLARFHFQPEVVDAVANDRGTEYGADLIFHLTPRFGLVGGIGLIESVSESLFELPQTRAC